MFGYCQQAYWRQILIGDINEVQFIALQIAKRLERKRHSIEIRDVKDFWLMHEYPDRYNSMIQHRKFEKEQEKSDVSLSADSMSELIALMEQKGL